MDLARNKLSWTKVVSLNILIIASIVLFGDEGGFFFHYISSYSPLWIPSGIAVGVGIVFGLNNTLAGILIGSLILTLQKSMPLVSSAGITAATLVEVLIGTFLLKSYGGGKYYFKKIKDIFVFVTISAVLAPFVSCTVIVASLYWGNNLPTSGIQHVWVTYLVSNSLGILVVAPLVISFSSTDNRKVSFWEAIVLYSSLAVSSVWSFQGTGIRTFLIIPVLTWSSIRFGFRGVSICALIVGYIAYWCSLKVGGVFDKKAVENDLLMIQLMIGVITIVGYFLATVVEAQETANEKELELTIKEDALAILDQSLHKSPIGFALINKDLKYIRVNEVLAKINGIEPNAHLGKSLYDVIPGICDKIIPIIQDVLRTGKSYTNLPFTGATPSNPDTFVAGILSYYPVRHPATHEIFAVAFSFQDITELSKIQSLLMEYQERMRFAQEAGKIGAFEWDVQTSKIIWTQELENIYDLSPGEFGGSYGSWLNWIHPSDTFEFNKEINNVLRHEQELNHQFRIVTQASMIRWILVRGRVVMENDGRKKLIGINIDITEQKEIEQKLRLTEANLLHALSVRDEFMAIASHELKTPLTSLKLANQFFQRGMCKINLMDETSTRIHSFIDKNCVQIDRLTRLVDDMLDISRIRTGKFSLKKEPCELSSMLTDILARTKEQFDASGSGQPIIENMEKALGEWDPLRIDQVLTNIITNAIRYGQGKPVRISLKNYQECVRVIVKDQGLGIPKSDQEKIFMRYERGLLSREISGLGLGLFITKQIVDAHGGTIRVESELNQGATFIVDLPRTALPVIIKPEITDAIEAEN